MHITIRIVTLAAVCVSITGCKVSKTQDGQMPTVAVSANGGQLPKYNVQGPKVEVGTKTETVKVPTMHIKTP